VFLGTDLDFLFSDFNAGGFLWGFMDVEVLGDLWWSFTDDWLVDN
jgi:hypothetical protein